MISLSSIRQFQSQYIRIGKSSEGKDLFLLKVGMPSPRGVTKPAVWIDGGVHARYKKLYNVFTRGWQMEHRTNVVVVNNQSVNSKLF